jgi:hypothetical protein
MSHSNRLIKLSLLAAAAGGVAAVAVTQLRAKQAVVDTTAQGIHDQLDALDPLTREAVIARLTKDAAKDVEARLGRS